ncbi:hypothetical protein [Streptomyces peucetius]|uniref:Uncharacterized protein n=1 Tax=Streptomyces peucetius TaxID=1950 RepID=A0ABY6IA08_STRPE|nr:hypothetical protein [Streptomyces peucetius]UYQ62794.1 hypothetical protein OGH68_15770 [Streptomyces peucetius]
MTHSGQGDEQRPPAGRPAHEGVVLPADGSEPLIPGTPDAQTAPAGGQPWGAPWGPQQPPPQAAPGYGYPGPPPAQGGGEAPQGYGYPGAPAQAGGYGYPAQPGPYAAQTGPYAAQPQQPSAAGGHPPYGDQAPATPGPQFQAQPLPPQAAHGPGPQGGHGPGAPQGGPAAPGAPAGAMPPQNGFPQAAPYGAAPQGQYPAPGGLPPQAAHDPGPYGANPQTGAARAADSDATQYIAPVGPGALPPEMPAESTTFLGTGRLDHGGPQSAQSAPPQGADAEATQYIAPVPPAPSGAPFGIRPGAPGDRQPPAEFDSLFRSEGHGGPEPADATQQMPRFQEPSPAYRQQPHQQPPSARHAPQYDAEPEQRRRSTAPVVAALVIGCAVLGLGVGAVMFGGEDDDKDPAPDKIVAADSPAPTPESPSPEASADPAEPQAEELDKLLADSNNSRDAVVRSVQNIKVCKNLDQAAADLKGAAEQRRELVTRLSALSVDKLPDNAALTASLTKAWQASASADDHYAAWAVQVKGKKGCKDGKARVTKQTALGNDASREATAAKNQASKLWNSIARKYDLTQRSSGQL